jgi:protocatechuate 3,4-dioxygenase beta subunit
MKHLGWSVALSLLFSAHLLAEGVAHLTVTDRFGRDVPASVCIVQPEGCAAIAERPIPVPGTDLLVRISAPGFEILETRLVAGEQSLKLKAKGSVSASFLSTEKNQEWTAEVSLARDENGQKGRNVESKKVLLPKAPQMKAITFEDVPTGEYWLVWEGPQIASEAMRVSVKDPAPLAAVKVEIRGDLSVRGFVRDSSGSPIPEAEIRFSDPTRVSIHQPGWKAATASTGEFTVAGLPIAKLEYTVSSKGHVEAEGEWSGVPSFDVALEKAQLIRGRVVDEKKEPIADVTIHKTFRFNSTHRGGAPEASGADGRFQFYRELPGDLTLSFSAQRYLDVEMKVPAATDKDVLDLGDVVLSRGRTISGSVADAVTGQPVDGATVSVSETPGISTTSGGGRFTLESAPDSDVILVVTAAEYARRQAPVSKDSSEARITLTKGGVLKVRVCGTPAELSEIGVTAQTTSRPTQRHVREANGTGEFEFRNVSPGEYFVGVQWKLKNATGYLSFQSVSETSNDMARIEDGQTVNISLRCDGVPVAGVINRAVSSGSPIWGVLGTEKNGWVSEFRADETGRFSTRVLVPDRYLLQISFPNGLRAKQGEFCVVPEGGKTDCVFTVTGP